MRKNSMKQKLQEGRVVFVSWLDLGPQLVEIMGHVGFDAVVLEQEHACRDLGVIEQLIIAADAAQIPALVRLRDFTPTLVQQILGAGAAGIIACHVKTREDALRAVSCAKYPPLGIRGNHSCLRSTEYVGALDMSRWGEVTKEANEQTLVVAVIEDPEGADNAAEIASVQGLDVLFFGPGDMALSMGLAGQWEHPQVLAQSDKVVKAARSQNKWVWMHLNDPGLTKTLIERGANIISFGHDVQVIPRWYREALQSMIAAARELGVRCM